MTRHRLKRRFVFTLGLALAATPSSARASFLDRPNPDAVRVVTWNIYFDSVFADVNSARNRQFVRVASALSPDVWAFQEMPAQRSPKATPTLTATSTAATS